MVRIGSVVACQERNVSVFLRDNPFVQIGWVSILSPSVRRADTTSQFEYPLPVSSGVYLCVEAERSGTLG
jgi:hypothetical protein